MKTNFLFIKVLVVLFLVSACSSDDDEPQIQNFSVAFENPSSSFSAADTEKDLTIVFAPAATDDGTITLSYSLNNAVYGDQEDFTTVPSGETGTITLNFTAGAESVTFKVNKLRNPVEGTTKSITFRIDEISLTNAAASGNIDLLLSFTESAALGGVFSPTVGGPNEPNQVFVDLSSQTETPVRRDTWDLAFYNGSEFRVKLNGSVYMGAAPLTATDINAVTSSDTEVTDLQALITVGAAGTHVYFDDATGDITNTVIDEVSATDADNPIYLVSLGSEIGTDTPSVGSVAITGGPRGWKKVRFLRSGDNYVVQYADLDDTTFQEATITKGTEDSFEFFSFATDGLVDVEPAKEKWDLQFTPFPQFIDFGGGLGAYGFADFITINTQGSVSAYMVETTSFTYEDFAVGNVDQNAFIGDDQRVIGSSWRSVFSGSAFDDRFYVLKDPADNIYKIRFNALTNESGERGFPAFEYELLQ
ncbi:MAG: HmuY family protein [Bacteroidota bacterium]